MTSRYVCPWCGGVSHNAHDLEQGYCARCDRWREDLAEGWRAIEPELLRLGDGGYSRLCVIGGVICGLGRFAFTTGLMVGMTLGEPYSRRYCYEHEVEALVALLTWDGEGHPPGPWIKVKGRMGDHYVDELGPGALK